VTQFSGEGGWIEHDGGPRPVDLDRRVVVKHRSGAVSTNYVYRHARYCWDDRAGAWGWHHSGDPGDIIAYRLISTEGESGLPEGSSKPVHDIGE
jgi:hypothetical protein